MQRHPSTLRTIVVAVPFTLAIAGCQPAEVGTIAAPAIDRSLGPTSNPNQPDGGSTIPAADQVGRGKPSLKK
ncbi:hypothetical protein [Singulisphaera acidiphila]|uniref:Lipoprotein n=1 Tax=Singulisphaera acidiphila (strain ATCC BAA-1392 / DSM 18658 / VKM B-2454 / MOB10) TaxID=886293 RepID=L0DGZ3_SINAD|nr:hypothetical protein [Singulisphaera acidiphila]AGA28088.1 hypothetical protein Sinac_3858 [Singulisphaera acidiphila DSM 18658]